MGARARIFAAAVAVVLTASVASAQTGCGTCSIGTLYAEKAPSSGSLTVFVTASVGGRCGFATAPSGDHDEPDFDDHDWEHDFTFQLDCTGPSRVAVTSQNGGLLTTGTVPSGYATLAPYDVALHLDGNSVDADGSCTAADLGTGGGCAFRGTASTTTGLRLGGTSINQTGSYLRVSAPAYAGANVLVYGDYQDILTVTVSAAP